MPRPIQKRRAAHLTITNPNGHTTTRRVRIRLDTEAQRTIEETRDRLVEDIRAGLAPSGTYRIRIFEGPLSRRGHSEEMIDSWYRLPRIGAAAGFSVEVHR